MDIAKNMDLPSLHHLQQPTTATRNTIDNYELSIHFNMNFDLMAANHHPRYDTSIDLNKSLKSELKEPELFKFKNGVDNQQHQSNNDTMMMPHNATRPINSSSASPIWLHADKSPHITPNEYESWIKIHEGVNEKKSPALRRKKSLLSTVSYDTEKEDALSTSSSGSSEDDITPPTTPTNEHALTLKLELGEHDNDIAATKIDLQPTEHEDSPFLHQVNLVQDNNQFIQTNDHVKSGVSVAYVDKSSLCDIKVKPENCATQQRAKAEQKSRIQNPDIVYQHNMQPNLANSSDQKQKNRISWFGGLFNDKTKSKKLTKTASISNLFPKTFSNTQKSASTGTFSDSANSATVKKRHSVSYFSNFAFDVNGNQENRSHKKVVGSVKEKMPTIAQAVSQMGKKCQQSDKQMPVIHTRYPLSVERSLYFLSNTKLGSPKRPLHQQVLISNLMYWYLSITERKKKNQQTYYQKQQQQQQISYYHATIKNKRQQQDYFNNLYQATYHSFEPPAPGGVASIHIPPSSKKINALLPPSSLPPPPPPHLSQQTQNNNSHTKYGISKKNNKKYEPVKNTQYVSPL